MAFGKPKPVVIRSIRSEVRQAVFARDGKTCRYCGNSHGPFHLDHVFPWSRGGANEVENLVVACAPCNIAKRDRTPEEIGWDFGKVQLPVKASSPQPKQKANWKMFAKDSELSEVKSLDEELARLEQEAVIDRVEKDAIMMRCVRRMRRDRGVE